MFLLIDPELVVWKVVITAETEAEKVSAAEATAA